MPTEPSKVATHAANIVSTLTQFNVALPVVMGTVISIMEIVKVLRGNPEELRPLIAKLEAQLVENEARGRAEIERLKALL